MYVKIKMIISSPNSCACLIASRVTWDPCPSKMNICLLVKDIPFGIDFLKKDKNSLKRKVIIHVFYCIAIQVLGLENCM
jgi:hypothetical protein